jgi:hypothetical protein
MSLKSTKLQCLLTHKLYICCDTNPAEPILKGNTASRKMVPSVKPISYYKVEDLEFLKGLLILMISLALSLLVDECLHVPHPFMTVIYFLAFSERYFKHLETSIQNF